MSYKVDYTYEISGFFDSVNYYRSQSQMNPLSMPLPTDTNIEGMAYSDIIEKTGKYYVRFSALKGISEKISDEKIVLAGKFHTFFNTDGDTLVDLCENNKWQNTNSVTISNGAVIYSGGAITNTTKTVNMNNDFHIHFKHKITSLGDFNFSTIFRSFISTNPLPKNLIFAYTGNGNNTPSQNTGTNVKHRYIVLLTTSQQINYCSLSNIVPGIEYEVDFIRKNNIFYLYIDKVLQFSFNATTVRTLDSSSEMFFSGGPGGNSTRDSWIKTNPNDIFLPT